MHADRRTFLKTTAAGVVSATAAALASAAPVEAQAAAQGAFEMPRNMTLLNMRTAAGPRLGVKLPKGVLDVAAAAAMYKLPAPVDTDDLLQNGKGGHAGDAGGRGGRWSGRGSICRRARCGTRRSSRVPRRSS